jgi:putative tricarboxylic transport membrane protein
MASETDSAPLGPARRRVVRAPRELAAGLSLIALGAAALWSSADLEMGTLVEIGAGMLPRATALLMVLAGLGFAVLSFLRDGEALERWTLRGPLFLVLGLVGFALTIRTVGLVLAGPLVVLIGGAGSPEARVKELAVLAVLGTLFCIGLFHYVLTLPIPIWTPGD